jgi:transcriptional regulator with XRE-family HTH domain
MENFPETLRALRESRGLTQVRLAELIDVSPRVYNRWETSAAAPRLDTLVKIADILNVTLDELVGRTEPTSEVVIQNPKLHALYREINRLSDEDQQDLVILLDSLVKRSRMDKVLAG